MVRLLSALLLMGVLAHADSITLDAVRSGAVAHDGSLRALPQFYGAGFAPTTSGTFQIFRNYFWFDLSSISGPITSATLQVESAASNYPPGNTTPTGYSSSDPFETFELYDVSTPLPLLNESVDAGNPQGLAIYQDFGSGALLGSKDISRTDAPFIWQIPLNSNGIAYLNSKLGAGVALGGKVSTLTDPVPLPPYTSADVEGVFASFVGTRQLAVTTSSLPQNPTTVVPEPTLQDTAARDRIGVYDPGTAGARGGNPWRPLAPGEVVPAGNVHVVTHGWAPGQRSWVDTEDDPRAWNNRDYFEAFDELAASLSARNDSTVLAFSWIDGSATDLGPLNPGSVFPSRAAESAAARAAAGVQLARAIAAAGVDEGFLQSGGKLQLIGHSHGAQVSGLATLLLHAAGIDVDQLTLLDSPEQTPILPDSLYDAAYNNLDLILAEIISNIPAIAIDNFWSAFGDDYAIDGVVNVDTMFKAGHSEPIRWYARGIAARDDWIAQGEDVLAVLYSPLEGDRSGLTAKYVWAPGDLVDPPLPEAPRVGDSSIERIEALVDELLGIGAVTQNPDGTITIAESSPGFWYGKFVVPVNASAFTFSYTWNAAGDGDYVGIWIDEMLVSILFDNQAGGPFHELIDLSWVSPGDHFLTIALYSEGDRNAIFTAGDFAFIRVQDPIPEPSSVALVLLAACFVWQRRAH